jgi:hypothetical protein
MPKRKKNDAPEPSSVREKKRTKYTPAPLILLSTPHLSTSSLLFSSLLSSPLHLPFPLVSSLSPPLLYFFTCLSCLSCLFVCHSSYLSVWQTEERRGEERRGEERRGEERRGEERRGEERRGEERRGEERRGEGRRGEGRRGEETTGEEITGEEITGEDRRGQERTGEEPAEASDKEYLLTEVVTFVFSGYFWMLYGL